MDRVYRRTRSGRRVRARRTGSLPETDRKTRVLILRLAACGIIFAIAALTKILFPSFAADIGSKLTATVDYRSALSVLGEGITGDKSFTAAVGEAITYAFRGTPADGNVPDTENVSGGTGAGSGEIVTEDNGVIPAWNYDSTRLTYDTPEPVQYGTAYPDPATPDPTTSRGDAEAPDTAEEADNSNELANAIISAFLQTQEGYSDYKVPAGTTYEMPAIEASCTAPVDGKITSGFGFRAHPVDGDVKFHYGVDFAAAKGDPILAFSYGDVLAVGESTTLGKYVMVTHDGFETLYAHCDDVLVSSGQAVALGDEIATAGDSGNATSVCLHFELKIGGIYVNPGYYLEG